MENEVNSLVTGILAGGGVVGLVALLLRLLFAREKSEYSRLEARIVVLETSLHNEQTAHLECVKKMGALEGRVVQLTQDMNDIIQRHDVKNVEQIIKSKEETIQLLLSKLDAIESSLAGKLDSKVDR
jgi:hypothetical protein